jgi:L-ascorbate metabolism protein UlaG (beta-lactamase superfamily)
MKLTYRITQFVAFFIWIIVFHGCQGVQGDNHKNQLHTNSISNLNLAEKEIVIKWFGQSCFLIVTSEKTQILTDPIEFKGYHLPNGIEPDLVTVSHNHPDHNRLDVVDGNPIKLIGTSANIQNVLSIDKKINDVRIYTVPSYHDPGRHGMNAIFVFEFDGIRIVHLGDLGMTLSDSQIEAIGNVDILMIPVGGQFTISGATADSVINQLKVKSIVFPMHYKTDAFNSLPYSAEEFLREKEYVKRISENKFILILAKMPRKREYFVMDYN